jgi:hypothetical protein
MAGKLRAGCFRGDTRLSISWQGAPFPSRFPSVAPGYGASDPGAFVIVSPEATHSPSESVLELLNGLMKASSWNLWNDWNYWNGVCLKNSYYLPADSSRSKVRKIRVADRF